MEFVELNVAGVARSLSQLQERDDDVVDGYFEAIEEVELPVEHAEPGLKVSREHGLAVRLMRDARTWLSSRDELSSEAFTSAVRQVARTLPSASYSPPVITGLSWNELDLPTSFLDFPVRLDRRIRQQHVAFPRRLRVRRHRRLVQVVGSRLVPQPEREEFFSVQVESAWGVYGTLCTSLEERVVERIANDLVDRFRARDATPIETRTGVLVLGPSAAAVLLHEAVAHALEADLLALTGRPEAAVGVALGGRNLHVLDDPGSAPVGVRRTTDDEGSQVVRRWLLRGGRVEQPLADLGFGRSSESLVPGAGRRSGRHAPPGPRSSHLELLPGDYRTADLLQEAGGGLFIRSMGRGSFDPLTGRCVLTAPSAQKISGGVASRSVGAVRIDCALEDLLRAIRAVGSETEVCGAGWCAKNGQRMPVWATAPAIRLEGVEVTGG